jgi:hypothetical protein
MSSSPLDRQDGEQRMLGARASVPALGRRPAPTRGRHAYDYPGPQGEAA